ncbi:MAG: carboxypeptidase-like regulatory domain-containing protein, partial [Muribaculum sp.]|nr:carboxypeptidase-like regulatory domain-containing protein [Muribaculum sp.]
MKHSQWIDMATPIRHRLISLSLILSYLLVPQYSLALDTKIQIVDTENTPVADASVIASRGDSIMAIAYSNEKGIVEFSKGLSAPLDIEVQALGYKSALASIADDNQPSLTVTLERSGAATLDELVVVADRSHTVKRLANGQRFFLSKEATSQKNPF